MITNPIITSAKIHLDQLCNQIPGRAVGSLGNQAATDYFAHTVMGFGFKTQMPRFECMDWFGERVMLFAGEDAFEAFPSPYSRGCEVNGPLVTASTVADLEALELEDKLLLLYGDIASEQLMPKNFPFYNPDEHKHIIRLLETKHPLAIITAPAQKTMLAGGQYPYALIEDGDFDIPSVYMTREEGDLLRAHTGDIVTLKSSAWRIPSGGCNVIARKDGEPGRRIVFCAHIDAKSGTPGAIDNASGVIILLLLADLLKDYQGKRTIELVALNGEDYYSNPGEQQFLALYAGQFDEIDLGINIDGVGYYKGKAAYSLYNCPDALAETIAHVFAPHPLLAEGDPWYQGDHVLFLLNQRPALALTSQLSEELVAEVIHTADDTPDIVDTDKLAAVALALHDLVMTLHQEA